MLVMIDDVQFESTERFFCYISKALGCEEEEIKTVSKLFDVLCDFEDEIEVTFYDTDEIKDEMKPFAEEVLAAFMNAQNTNEKLSVLFEKTTL